MSNDPIRIAVVSNYFAPAIGGLERQNQLIGEALVRRGHKVTVLTRRYDPALASWENLNGLEIRRFGPGGRGVVAKWLVNLGVCRHIGLAKSPYDVVLVTQFSAHIVGTAIGCIPRGIPYVIRTDEEGEFSGAISEGSLKRLPVTLRPVVTGILQIMRKWALRRADGVLALSKSLAREAEVSGFPRDCIALEANAVDLEQFHPVSHQERCALRRGLGIPENAEVVVYVARLVKGKGHSDLIDAWVDIAREWPTALLLLVGGGPGFDSPLDVERHLRNAIEEFGLHERIRMTGDVNDVERFLQASDVFVFPSHSEAFGMALSEAMACGLPVVCSAMDGGAGDLIVEGVHGFRFPIGNVKALREKTVALLADAALRRAMGDKGRKLAETQVSLEPIVDRHERLFRAVIARHRSVVK